MIRLLQLVLGLYLLLATMEHWYMEAWRSYIAEYGGHSYGRRPQF